ncbi:hypothetical protein [Pseudonocardia lacus]|uniref:hypothetical protein n=1 Tax=Pseudonocardia lacus TaxID=2835865 RepID=UPI0020289677|nr:hypothetical protein [Pseudonocardia lacus]
MTPPRIDDVAAFFGSHVVRARALHQCGFARSTVTYRCRSGGPWQLLLPGIVLLHNGPPTRADRRRAALLYCGEREGGPPGRGCRAVLTGLDALELHGMRRMPSPSGPVHVLVLAEVRRAGCGRLLVERTERLPDPGSARWPIAPVARAALDFSRRSRDRSVVRALLAEAVQRGLCDVPELVAELEAGSGRGSALPREVLAEVGAGVRSPAEAEARALVLRSGLPEPLWNPRLHDERGRFLAMPDAWFGDVGLAWEIDSLEWHLGPSDYAATVDRRNRLMTAGAVVVHHLPRDVRHHPARVLADLRANYARAAQRPLPVLHAV